MADVPNFWPEFKPADEVTPNMLLKQQAANLSKATNGILEGAVSRTVGVGTVYLSFNIVAPALDHHSYELFSVRHHITASFPADVVIGNTLPNRKEYIVKVNSADEFLDLLKQMLSSEATQKIVGALIAQSRS